MIKYFAYKFIRNDPEAAFIMAAKQMGLHADEKKAKRVIQGLINQCFKDKRHISKNPTREKKAPEGVAGTTGTL